MINIWIMVAPTVERAVRDVRTASLSRAVCVVVQKKK